MCPINCWRNIVLRPCCEQKILVSLAASNEDTADVVQMLFNYVATYPNNGITYQDSNIIIVTHSVAGYLSESKACSHAVAHILLSEDEPVTRLNGSVLTIAQIIEFIMSSVDKAELEDLFITIKNMVPIRQTLIEMGWPNPSLLSKLKLHGCRGHQKYHCIQTH